jgi:hypothetical protein
METRGLSTVAPASRNLYKTTETFLESLSIGGAINHDPGQRFSSIQRNIRAVSYRIVDVNLSLFQKPREILAM